MGSNKQVFNFSKTVGRVSREIRNTSKSGRESQESRNVSKGVEQTIVQFFKNCRPSKSRKSKHI